MAVLEKSKKADLEALERTVRVLEEEGNMETAYRVELLLADLSCREADKGNIPTYSQQEIDSVMNSFGTK